MLGLKTGLISCVLFLLFSFSGHAQFLDHFDKKELHGWFFFPGDGDATMKLVQQERGYATVYVDATKDRHNVWYAISKRNVAPYLNLKKLEGPDTELRVEARVKIYNPPHRVNFMVNTQRTIEFHHDLMEFELPDTNWHVISMTTKDLDAVPGDSLYVQFNVTDYGWHQYKVDIDYVKADIINTKTAAPDKGIRIPYHPPIPALHTFSNHLDVQEDALLNADYPEINLNDWQVRENDSSIKVLTVGGNQWAILRWDLDQFKTAKADGAGVLEITTQSVATGGNYIKAYGQQLGEEFPRVRVIEIFEGQPGWDGANVTYNSFMQGKSYETIFNTQMIFDIKLDDKQGNKNFITISEPVMQRLLDGKTKGLLIRPLGAIYASFYSAEEQGAKRAPKLYFNTKK